jgi:hypothetical protein
MARAAIIAAFEQKTRDSLQLDLGPVDRLVGDLPLLTWAKMVAVRGASEIFSGMLGGTALLAAPIRVTTNAAVATMPLIHGLLT